MNTPFLIGICGGTCSGKTTASRIVMEKFKEHVTLFKQDSFYKTGGYNGDYDHYLSIDFPLLVEKLKELMEGNATEIPIYDFATHSRTNKTETLYPNKIILVEGILIFYCEELRNMFNLKVFVEASMDTRYYRRLNRDQKERGRSKSDVQNQWNESVKPSHILYVEPTRYFADITIHNDNNDTDLDGITIKVKMILLFIENYINQ